MKRAREMAMMASIAALSAAFDVPHRRNNGEGTRRAGQVPRDRDSDPQWVQDARMARADTKRARKRQLNLREVANV